MIRKAKLNDVEPIKAILDHYAEKKQLLPRSLSNIVSLIRDFFVFEQDGKVVGCVALHFCWLDLGEIRSLAVDEKHQGNGIGKELLEHALEEAKQLGLKKVFALTYKPDFFEKSGFNAIDKGELPHKIWSDCINCPHFPDCNEIAMEIRVG